MDWILYLVAGLFFLLGGVCLILVILQLPGGWVILALAVIINLVDDKYLSDPEAETFQWWLLGVCLGLLVIGEILEFVAGSFGAQQGGASRRGMIGALIGGIAGAIALAAPLAIVPLLGPVFGALLGAIVGTFAGAIIGEMSGRDPRTIKGSLKPATGATIGRVVGTVSKVGITVVIWLTLSVAAVV